MFRTESANVTTSGTASTLENELFLDGQATSSAVNDFQLNATNKSLIPNYQSGTNFPDISSDEFSFSFWARFNEPAYSGQINIFNMSGSTNGVGIQCYLKGGSTPRMRFEMASTLNNVIWFQADLPSDTDDWHHYTIVMPSGLPSSSNKPTISKDGGTLTVFTHFYSNGTLSGSTLAATAVATTSFSSVSYQNTNGAARSRSGSSSVEIDELAFYSKRLSQTEANAIYNSGSWHDLDQLASSYNLQRYFRMGDGPNDSVANIQMYDIKNTSDYIEKVGSGSHGIGQLTMNDSFYSSSTGNHKYISVAPTWSLSGGDSSGNSQPTGRIGTYHNIDSTKYLFGAPNSNKSASISIWYHPVTSIPNATGTMLFQTVLINNSNTTQSVKFGMMYYSTKIYTVRANLSNTKQKNYSTGAGIGSWRHLVLTMESDGSSSNTYTEKLYLNGVLKNTFTGQNKSDLPYLYDHTGFTNYGFSTGTGYDNDSSHALSHTLNTNNANIDEMSTYNIALSQSQVTSLFNNGSPSDLTGHTGIEHWFRMGDGDNDTGTSIACVFHPSTTLTSLSDYRQNH